MEANIVDLRYKMKDVLMALNRRERVKVFYHGKQQAVIIPTEEKTGIKVSEHPLFGILKMDAAKPVSQVMDFLRGGRLK